MNFDNTNNTNLHNDGELQTVQVTADPRSTLRALSATFTASLTVISELLQNGRRAGATKIDVTVKDDLIVVQDNGCGLDDFSILLKVAESGWNEDVQNSDSPYGIGWLSSLFSCRYIGVMSKGKHLYAATADLIGIKPVVVNESADLGVTEIRLHEYTIGNRYEVEQHLKRVAKGFPVPIFLNGVELERPHAVDQLDLIPTSVGLVTEPAKLYRGVSAFYLQGLPINVSWVGGHSSYRRGDEEKAVVHLDSTRFKGRMPDRSCLINPEVQGKLIDQELMAFSCEHLTNLATQMSEEEFVTKHWDLAVRLNMRDLLNSMKVLPADKVAFYASTPRQTSHHEVHQDFLGNGPGYSHGSPVVTAAQLTAKGLFVVEEVDYPEGLNLLADHVLHGLDVILGDDIPHWHWAFPLIGRVCANDFVLEVGKEIRRAKVSICYQDVELVLVESLSAQFIGASSDTDDETAPRENVGQLRIGDVFSVPMHWDYETSTLYVTSSGSADDIIWQASAFTDEEGHDDEACEAALRNVTNTLNLFKTSDYAALLQELIRAGTDSNALDALAGLSFKVEFNESGTPSVTQTRTRKKK